MNTYRIDDETFQGSWIRRVLRVTLGTAAFGAVLTGYANAPAGIFVLSAASIYCMVTAILDQGLLDVLFRAVQTAAAERTASHACNMADPERVTRGAAAGAALGSVLSGAFVMDAGDIFTLGAAGAFLGLTATVAWCPLIAGLQFLLTRRAPMIDPARPSTAAAVSPVAGRMTTVAAPAGGGQTQEAA